SDLESDREQEALTCKVFYDTCRKKVLSDFAWPFATKRATLNLIEEDPNDEWCYSYQYPSDCVRAIEIFSGVRNNTRQTRVEYEIADNGDSSLIFTDEPEAILKYTRDVTNTDRFPA